MYHQQPAFVIQGKLPLCNHDDPERPCQVLVVGAVFLVFRLGDEHVGQGLTALQLLQALEIVGLVAPDAKPYHQVQDQSVIVLPDLVAAVLFRLEIAGDAELVRVVEHDAWPLVNNALGDYDMGVEALLPHAVKMDKAAHGVQKPPGNGEPQAKSAGQAAGSGIRLIKDIVDLGKLVVRHTDAGVADVNDQIDAVSFPAVSDPDVYAALFREFDGVFHQNFEHVGDLLRISDEGCRHLRVNVKHQLQVLPVALQRGHGNHVVQHGSDHVFLLRRRQRPFHDFRVVQHIVDLVGQPLSRQLDGRHIRPDLRGKILAKGDLADPDDHVDGGAELVRNVRQKDGVLLSRRLQFREHAFIPLLLYRSSLNPVYRESRPAKNHNSAKRQAKGIIESHLMGNGMEDQTMIQQYQYIQGLYHIQQPLFIQHEQREDHDAGHGRDIEQNGFMHAEEKELHQQHSGAQVLIERF